MQSFVHTHTDVVYIFSQTLKVYHIIHTLYSESPAGVLHTLSHPLIYMLAYVCSQTPTLQRLARGLTIPLVQLL